MSNYKIKTYHDALIKSLNKNNTTISSARCKVSTERKEKKKERGTRRRNYKGGNEGLLLMEIQYQLNHYYNCKSNSTLGIS